MDFLNKDQTTAVKGILCIVVLLSHSCGPLYIRFFGAWAVSCFFFLSGYALELTTANKEVTGRFILRRALSLITPVLLCEILYHPLYSLIGMNEQMNTVAGVINGLITFYPPINVSWYVEILVVFSVLFLVLRRFFKTDFLKTSLFFISFYVVLLCYVFMFTTHSYVMKTALWFYIGTFYSHNRKTIEEKFRNKKWIKYPLMAIALISFVLPWVSLQVEYPLSGVAIVTFDNTAPLLVFGIASIIDLRNKLTIWLGKLSLWIYLLHFGVMLLSKFVLRNIEPLDKVPVWFMVIVITIPMAFVYDCIYRNTIQKLINRLK